MRFAFAWRLAGAAALAASASTAAWAHHSTALYDFKQSLTLKGTVRSFQWANPHNYLQLVVTDAKGKQVEWSIEAGTPATATRQGWTKDVVHAGDKVTVVVAPMRNGKPDGTIKTITLPNGKVLSSVAADPKASSPFDAIPTLKRVPPQ